MGDECLYDCTFFKEWLIRETFVLGDNIMSFMMESIVHVVGLGAPRGGQRNETQHRCWLQQVANVNHLEPHLRRFSDRVLLQVVVGVERACHSLTSAPRGIPVSSTIT